MEAWRRGELRRLNILEGSVSSGKTWVSLVLWAFWVKTQPREKLYLMCGKTLTTLKRNCLMLLQELVGEGNFQFSIANKEGCLLGRRILLEGANDARSEGTIRGLTLQGAYCDELTQMPEDFFQMLLSRLRLPGAKLIATTNPDRPGHWLKVDYLDRADELDLLRRQFLLWDNTTLPQEYVNSVQKEFTGVFYERFILGRWTLAQGLIYPMYPCAIATAPQTPAEGYVLSVDYGTMNAFAAGLWERHGDVWYMTREYHHSGRQSQQQKTDEEYARDLERFVEDITPGEGLRTIVDPSAASFITLMRRQGRRFRAIPADNAVADGIRQTASALANGRIKIDPGCRNWLREVQGYVWDEDEAVDRPVKVEDHQMDQMRYFVKTLNIAKPRREN